MSNVSNATLIKSMVLIHKNQSVFSAEPDSHCVSSVPSEDRDFCKGLGCEDCMFNKANLKVMEEAVTMFTVLEGG